VILLSLDPSTTAIGWAVMKDPEHLTKADRLLPKNREADARERIDSMLPPLSALMRQYEPTYCVVELPGKAMYGRRIKGLMVAKSRKELVGRVNGIVQDVLTYAGAPWSVYGYLVSMAELGTRDFDVGGIPADVWTRGMPKKERLLLARLQFAQYKAQPDPDGDIGDAIGLGLYWFRRERQAGANRAIEQVRSSRPARRRKTVVPARRRHRKQPCTARVGRQVRVYRSSKMRR